MKNRYGIIFSTSLTIICIFAIFQIANAETGKVVGVSDGDTITVLVDNTPIKVRLYGIDCPEKGQDYGKRARQFTSDVVFGKIVKLKIMDTDRYGRVVSIVETGDKNLNENLIQAGYAWVYLQYCKIAFCEKWNQYELKARNEKMGLWSHPNPVPPWEFRRSKPNKISSNQTSAGVYHGNTRSHVFHLNSCEHFNCKNCTQIFNSRDEAIAGGYRPCGRCKP